jgi:hypothetical protein
MKQIGGPMKNTTTVTAALSKNSCQRKFQPVSERLLYASNTTAKART